MYILWINNGVLLFWKRWKGHKNPGDTGHYPGWLFADTQKACHFQMTRPVISPLELGQQGCMQNHNLDKHKLFRQRCPIIPCRSRGIHIENCDHFYLQARPMAHMINGLGPCNYAITQWYATPWTRTRLWPTATVWRRHMLMLIYQCMCRSYIA